MQVRPPWTGRRNAERDAAAEIKKRTAVRGACSGRELKKERTTSKGGIGPGREGDWP